MFVVGSIVQLCAGDCTKTNETTNTTTEAVATTPAEEDIVMAKETINVWETIVDFAAKIRIGKMLNTENEGDWRNFVMLGVACLLLYLAIVKQFEPLLLLPIAFGMLLTNFPGANMFHEDLFAGGQVHWSEFYAKGGLLDYLYLGVKLGIYPCLIFIGIGAMTDFGPLIANPKSLLLGGAAQLGIFATFIGALALGFTGPEAGSIGIIGGADGPTAIFLTSKLAPHLLGPIAVAAYSYMALVPVIQPPIMRALTTKGTFHYDETIAFGIEDGKILFPIFITIICALLLPDATSLIGCLMFGNLLKSVA